MRLRSAAVPIAALGIAAALTACGDTSDAGSASSGMDMDSSSPASPSSSAGAEADIAFAQLMVPHHQQAVEMASLALKYGKSQDVKALAAQIQDAQSPEIEQMAGWLEDWGVPMEMDEGNHDMGGMTGSGMMSEEDMGTLASMRGEDFDQMWLRMMISHHEGAIQMAQDVLAQSSSEEVKTLAQSVIDGQTAEIDTMQQLFAN
jgi:uncharacterized protein (DUF305 family)